MRRSLRIALLLAAVVVFLLVSAGLARVLSANGAERDAILALLSTQARGDAPGMVARIDGCAADAACRANAALLAARLRSSGAVKLVRLDPSTSFSLGGTQGVARVVWTAPGWTTVVQCVRVRRGGDVLHGLRIELRALSRPIGHQSNCPSAG